MRTSTKTNAQRLGALCALGLIAYNPDNALSELTFGFRSPKNWRGEVGAITGPQASCIAAADKNGDGYVGWGEAFVDLVNRFRE